MAEPLLDSFAHGIHTRPSVDTFLHRTGSQYSEGVNALSTVWTERLQSSCRAARFVMRFCACSWTHLRIWPRSNSRAHPMSG
jgi:hypothetical protein